MPSADHSLMLVSQSEQKPIAADLGGSTAADSVHAATPATSSSPDSGASPSALSSTKSSAKLAHRKRARATSEQVTVLESVFLVNRSPASRLREDLAARLGMAPRQVQVWFQNRRAKEKTQQRTPRALQHHTSMLFDQLAYSGISPDFYSTFLPVGVDPASANGSGLAFAPSPAAMGFSAAPAIVQQQQQQQLIPQQSHIHHGMLDNHMSLAASSAIAGNAWVSWNMDIPQHQSRLLSSPAQYLGMPEMGSMPPMPHAEAPEASRPAGKAALRSTASAASLYAANITDSRRESEASAITAVASSPSASDHASGSNSAAAAATAAAVASPFTPPSGSALDTGSNGSTTGHSAQLSHKSSNNFSAAASVPVLPDAASSAASQHSISTPTAYPGCVAPPLGARIGGSARRPAPLSLVGGHNGMAAGSLAASSAAATAGGSAMLSHMGLSMGYSSYIPEIPSYMVLESTQLVVGTWQRVPMVDTELTCLACVEPPPLKPVQRPGNHRPTELDSLVGEFQWIIGSCGGRYKMVLPYTAICRIKFREIPDRAVSLLDVATDSVINTQAALSLLSHALKNPQAQGELSIHVYDLPTYYFQTESGGWTKIDDFSENMSASKTNVHTISGPFVSLYHQLRTLLATCSRLKSAADALMALWMGSMDDPYSAIAGIPHNTWIPCAETVPLHAPKLVASQPAEPTAAQVPADKAPTTTSAISPAFTTYMPPVSAASSTIGTLTPTPTSANCPQMPLPYSSVPPAMSSARTPVFAFHDATMPVYHNSIAAAMTAAGSGGVAPLPLKTQRSASLPFIRSVANGVHTAAAGKVSTSSSLCRTVDGESASPTEAPEATLSQPSGAGGRNELASNDASAASGVLAGLGISNTQPLPLRHRTSCNHLRRPAPYQVAPPAGSSWANSPQMSPSPFWHAHSLRRASRDSLTGHHHHHSHSTLGTTALPTPLPNMAAPPATFIRRESDAELALAMNHAFVNGDVLGAHRGFGDLYGGTGVPPSPLSNMTMAACASAMQVDSEDADESVEDDDGASHGLGAVRSNPDANSTTLACQVVTDIPLSLLPNEAYGPTSKPFGGLSVGEEGMSMSNADIVMAIFNAMSNAASTAATDDIGRAFCSADGSSLAAVQGSTDSHAAGVLDPTSFGYDPGAFLLAHNNNNGGAKSLAAGGPHAMDWCFDWSHAAPCGLSGTVPDLISTTATACLDAGKDDGGMRIDWTSSGATTAATDATCPGALAFGAVARSTTQN
ncbi:hypothetical protein GGI20_001403 [Coemansia sp. BCRC 34301]|nr:hypothetical protein GGI20_001403 [Coemansia sp. BCRC 34301]